ncbi:MAG: FemAB family PEP-CTERM system-associated protein [Candidatus Schekmanbacteria bacterium]|nr:FemAB family PEP-CTERM system-associated protein [Candidatus Schekmanbacteria bacterium]
MVITQLKQNQFSQWDNFLLQHSSSTFFHTTGWQQVINKTFQHRVINLCALENEKLLGIFPLVEIKNAIFGHFLISLPFGVYGGVCADDEIIEKELISDAIKLGGELGVNYLELREQRPLNLNLATKDLYMTFNLDLASDPEINWQNMRKRNRNILRKGIKSGLSLYKKPVWGQIDAQEREIFYHLFARTQTSLGTPVLPRQWFLNLVSAFPQDIVLFSTVYQNKIINSLMVFRFKDTLLPYYIGYDPDYLEFAPNNYILWEAIQFGCAQGFSHFDLGRSRKDTGSFEFKKHWGIEPKPLYYQYHLYPGQKMPNLSPSNPKYDLAKKIWSKLPLPLAKTISPYFIKYLG